MATGSDVTLVYCAAGGKRFAEIALDAGFVYGAQLPKAPSWPIWFADQDWKRPDLARYVAAIRKHRPVQATVLDWERHDQLPDVLAWAEAVAPYVERVVIIPKVFDGIERLPRQVGGAQVVLGYSVPTRFGATETPVWEFAGWPVHLLGGSPQAQLHLAHYLDVWSLDGNAAQRAAQRGVWWSASRRQWVTRDPDLSTDHDMPYRAFERSCREIMRAWRR